MTEYGRIYIIRNTINEKVYIGQTKVSLKLRFQNHLSAARRGLDYVIGKAIRKYGEAAFYIELLEECTVSELNERERYWISYFNSTNNKFGYNMSTGGNVVRTTKAIEEDKILYLFDSGMPAYKIAKSLHTAVPNITAVLKKYKRVYGQNLQEVNKQDQQMVVDLYGLGYSTVDIGKRLGYNKSTIRRVLKRNNVTLRTFKETKNLKRNLSTPNGAS